MSSIMIKKIDKISKIREKRLILANQVNMSRKIPKTYDVFQKNIRRICLKHTENSPKTYGEFFKTYEEFSQNPAWFSFWGDVCLYHGVVEYFSG